MAPIRQARRSLNGTSNHAMAAATRNAKTASDVFGIWWKRRRRAQDPAGRARWVRGTRTRLLGPEDSFDEQGRVARVLHAWRRVAPAQLDLGRVAEHAQAPLRDQALVDAAHATG